jgi:hypothetical protein
MASINATTSSGIVATADNTGQLQLQSAGTTVMTITSTGVTTQVGAPAFSAYLATNTSFSASTWSKVPCSTEEFDTNNNYDSTTNYRFTPTVAGYYQINGRWDCTVSATIVLATIYKNGVEFKRGVDIRASLSGATGASVSALIYMNGTTDYVELYAYAAATSPQFEGGQQTAYFQGFLARSA